jgi:hypothetical protein
VSDFWLDTLLALALSAGLLVALSVLYAFVAWIMP